MSATHTPERLAHLSVSGFPNATGKSMSVCVAQKYQFKHELAQRRHL